MAGGNESIAGLSLPLDVHLLEVHTKRKKKCTGQVQFGQISDVELLKPRRHLKCTCNKTN